MSLPDSVQPFFICRAGGDDPGRSLCEAQGTVYAKWGWFYQQQDPAALLTIQLNGDAIRLIFKVFALNIIA